jgi:hypothetical protein
MSEVNEENASDEVEEVIPEGKLCSVEEADRTIKRWTEAMGLSSKLDETGLFQEEVSNLRKALRDLRDAILDGHLVLDGELRFAFTPYDVGHDAKLGQLVFDEPDMAMLRKAKAERNPVDAQARLLQGMTKKDAIALGKLKNRNSAVCTAIVVLFLG